MKTIANLTGILAFMLISACGGQTASETNKEDVMEEKVVVIEEMVEDDEDGMEKEIAIADIPQVVKDALMAKYEGATIKEADELTNADGSLSYEIEIETSEGELEVIFSSNGEFQGLENDDDDDEEGEDDDNN